MSINLKTMKQFHDMGFALIYLNPKSKMPLEGGWTTGERKSWAELKSTFNPNYNVGVRLGTPSIIDGKYLAVVDVDVKSTDPKHKKEALNAVRRLLGELKCPRVDSGRGNGSRHYYCVTDLPFKTYNFEASSEIVKYHSPSKTKISKREREQLSEKEINSGIRLANAWEISLYSDGRQVVFVDSVHPDSGKCYQWKVAPIGAQAFPLFEPNQPNRKKEKPLANRSVAGRQGTLEDFELSPIVIDWMGLPEGIRPLIQKGLWKGSIVQNRSDYLLVAATGLLSAGCSRDDILTVLTEPDYYLGEVAYEHAQTKSRKRAAEWLWRYTVKKVMEERDARQVFLNAGAPEVAVTLSSEAANEQQEELEDKPELRGFYSVGPKGGKIPEYDALLKHFEKQHPFKTIADMKAVFTFEKTHYVDFTQIEIKGFAERKFEPHPEEKMRNEFLAKVLSNNIARRSFFTETTEGKVNFKNGVLDLTNDSGDLLPHSPDFGFRGVLPFQYDPFAECPVFESWLDNIMMGDKELIAILQEYMGYIVRGGEYKYHKALWLGGTGRNGKSTFVDVLKALIGAGNFSVISIKTLMGDKFAGADLDGKIANFSEETSPQELADSGPFKNLTGDGDIFAQKKYGDPYSFRNRAKLIMTYNNIPDLKDLSVGMLSRPLIIPFLKEIKDEDQDKGIKQKLFKELSGIFNFAMAGWERLEQQGEFSYSSKSELALKKVKEESCGVYQWVENHVSESANTETTYSPSMLYQIYTKTERYAFKEIEFFRRLNAHPKIMGRKKRMKYGFLYSGIDVK